MFSWSGGTLFSEGILFRLLLVPDTRTALKNIISHFFFFAKRFGGRFILWPLWWWWERVGLGRGGGLNTFYICLCPRAWYLYDHWFKTLFLFLFLKKFKRWRGEFLSGEGDSRVPIRTWQVARGFPKRFPVISQKVAQSLVKKQSKVAQKLLQKNKNFFWSDTDTCKLHNKSSISRTNLEQGAYIHQPTAWPVPDACAQPYDHADET